MSIFNKKWLGKSTVYLLASVSMSSTLMQTLSEVKVFANGEDKISWWKSHEFLLTTVLSWIFRKYNDAAEKVKMVLEYAYSVFLDDSSSKGADEKLKDSDNKSSDVGNKLDDSSSNKGTDEKLKNSDNKSSDMGNKLKDSKYKDICFNKEDLKLMEKFSEYTPKSVILNPSDKNIENIIDNVYGRGIEKEKRFKLSKVDLENNFVNIQKQEDLRFPAYIFRPILAKLDSNQSDEISFSKGENNSIVLTDRVDKEKVSFTVGSDGTIFLKTFHMGKCYVLPLRVAAKGFMFASGKGDSASFLGAWVFLDPLEIVNLFFEGDPCVVNIVEKKFPLLGELEKELEKIYKIFSEKPECEMLADAAKQAVDLYKALESCYKKIFEGKKVERKNFDEEAFMFNYRKELLRMIFNGEVPEECDKEAFENLRKHAINYFKYLGGFEVFLSDNNVKNNLEKSGDDVDNELKNSKYKDICFNKEDLELMKNFSEYTSKPVNLDLSDENIEKVIDNVYGKKSEEGSVSLGSLDLKKVAIEEYERETLKYVACDFVGSLAKLAVQNKFNGISFTKGMNGSAVLIHAYDWEGIPVKEKISFNRSSDGTIFIKLLHEHKYCTLPLRTALEGLWHSSRRLIANGYFVNCWRYLDPLSLVRLYFKIGGPYINDDPERGLTVLGTLKELYKIFSEKQKCDMLADAAKQAVELYEALESCYKKIFEGKTVSGADFCEEDFLLNYRKKLLKIILSGEIPEGCKIDKKVFDELRKHTINYFNYLGAFDFKDQKESQEGVLLNSQSIV